MGSPPTRWERWTEITTFPLLWIVVYLLWVTFLAAFIFWLFPIGGTAIQIVVFLVLSALPGGLVLLSSQMLKAYDRQ
jgi:membrane protein implicated in regulation of membrane protease activity